jgi:hypothetical protein
LLANRSGYPSPASGFQQTFDPAPCRIWLWERALPAQIGRAIGHAFFAHAA